jgi:hypothetical protein
MVVRLHRRRRQRRLNVTMHGAGVSYDVSFLSYEALTVFGCVESNPGWAKPWWWKGKKPSRRRASRFTQKKHLVRGGYQRLRPTMYGESKIWDFLTDEEKAKYLAFWKKVAARCFLFLFCSPLKVRLASPVRRHDSPHAHTHPASSPHFFDAGGARD